MPIPARRALTVGSVVLGPPDPGAASPFCVAVQPVSGTATAGARRRLAKALDPGLPPAGWADRLLTKSGKAPLHVSAQQGETVAPLFAMGRSAVLDAVALGLPEAGEAGRGGATRPDLQDYIRYLIAQLGKIGVLAPAQSPPTLGNRLVRVIGPDTHGDAIVRYSDLEGAQLSTSRPEREAWFAQLLRRIGNRSAIALLIEAGESGQRTYQMIADAPLPYRRSYRFVDPWRLLDDTRADARRSVAGAMAGSALPAGYRPGGSRALDLSYRAHGEGDEQSAKIASLAAHALERSWQLAPHPGLSVYSNDDAYLLSSRQAVYYRPEPRRPEQQGRPAPMLGEAAARAAAAGLVPSTQTNALLEQGVGVIASANLAGEQAFAPALITERDLSGRAGGAHMRRLGMAVGQRGEDGSQPAPLPAAEVVFNARIPRPPEIGTNDRLRADQHDPRNFAASTQPCFTLYGERAASPMARQQSPALGRDPLSAQMWHGTVIAPAEGVLTPAASGPIRLAIAPASRPSASHSEWLLKGVVLKRGALEFAIASFTQTSDDGTYEVRPDADFYLALGEVGEAGEFQLRLQFALRVKEASGAQFERVVRVVTLRLPVRTRGASGPEQPTYLRFEDPAFNERLQFAARVSARKVMAADREKLRPDDLLSLAWLPDREPEPATALRVSLTYFVDDNDKTGIAIQEATGWRVDEETCTTLIDCAALTTQQDGSDFDGLQPGGSLEVTLNVKGEATGTATMSMRFKVVQDDFLPRNPSTYALLELTEQPGSTPKLSAPLFVQSPDPASCDLLDPRDLLQGFARFVSGERWTYFVPRRAETDGETGPRHRFVIQKIAHDGGSHVPRELANWITLPPSA